MKRAGENLARTVDGAPYNKLQRPDTFPEAPPRPVANRRYVQAPQSTVSRQKYPLPVAIYTDLLQYSSRGLPNTY